MVSDPILSYVRAHWRGQQNLGWSFWVNLVALRVAITLGQAFLTQYAPFEDFWRLVVLTLGALVHGPVLVWQVVGVLRAGESHIRSLGSVTNTWGAQLGILVACWVALSDVWGLWLATRPAAAVDNFAERMAQEHASKYALTLSPNQGTATFDGEIALGSTKALAAMLLANPSVRTLILASAGGNIYEARGLAVLAHDNNLHTRVDATCASACTVAFIGGTTRSLGDKARLGFHQYRVDAEYDVPFADPNAEQKRDADLFLRAGVAGWFLERMYASSPSDMWFPDQAELRRAGVISDE